MSNVAVISTTDSVVVDSNTTVSISTKETETLVTSTDNTSIITTADQSILLVETNNPTVVVHGTMGPPGKDGIAEEDMVYAKRIDFLDENTIYRGEAPVGTSDNAPNWRIRLVSIAGDGDVSEQWASGTAAFDKIWADRASYTYL
jgi:hypothetical protein